MPATFPAWIEILFFFTCVVTLYLFHRANGSPYGLTLAIVGWAVVHSWLAHTGFYRVMDAMPPRFALIMVPAFLAIGYGLLPRPLAWSIARRDLSWSTFLHTVRIPVEIVLYYLFIYQQVPELMTFAGRNFDILIGLTAPVIGLLYLKGRLPRMLLLGWNIIGVLLVTFILVNGTLSAEFPFQQFGFEQPNRAVFYFPFVLLPAMVVPLVIYTHLVDIVLLWRDRHSATAPVK